MINPSGDLIVRPTFIEAAAQLMRPWGESPYIAPLVALLYTQYSINNLHSTCCLHSAESC